MDTLPFYNIPEAPKHTSPANIIARMVDGLGFRYYWATEGLDETIMSFRPSPSSMNMADLMAHIYSMSHTVNRVFNGQSVFDKTLHTFDDFRTATLIIYDSLSKRLKNMSDQELELCQLTFRNSQQSYSFWYLINGQIADSLTHVGQITSWRRTAGHPVRQGTNMFSGKGVPAS